MTEIGLSQYGRILFQDRLTQIAPAAFLATAKQAEEFTGKLLQKTQTMRTSTHKRKPALQGRMTAPVPLDSQVFTFYDEVLTSAGSAVWSIVGGLATMLSNAVTCGNYSCGAREQAHFQTERLDLAQIAAEMREHRMLPKSTQAVLAMQQKHQDVLASLDAVATKTANRTPMEIVELTAEMLLRQPSTVAAFDVGVLRKTYFAPFGPKRRRGGSQSLAVAFESSNEVSLPQRSRDLESGVQKGYALLFRMLGLALSFRAFYEGLEADPAREPARALLKNWLQALKQAALGRLQGSSTRPVLALADKDQETTQSAFQGSCLNVPWEFSSDFIFHNEAALAQNPLCLMEVPLSSEVQLPLFFWSDSLVSRKREVASARDLLPEAFPVFKRVLPTLAAWSREQRIPRKLLGPQIAHIGEGEADVPLLGQEIDWFRDEVPASAQLHDLRDDSDSEEGNPTGALGSKLFFIKDDSPEPSDSQPPTEAFFIGGDESEPEDDATGPGSKRKFKPDPWKEPNAPKPWEEISKRRRLAAAKRT